MTQSNFHFDFSLLENKNVFDSIFHQMTETQVCYQVEYPNCSILPTLCMLSMDFEMNEFIRNSFHDHCRVSIYVFHEKDSKMPKYIVICSSKGALAVRITTEFSTKLSLFVRSLSNNPIRFNSKSDKEICENYFSIHFTNFFVESSSNENDLIFSRSKSFRLFILIFLIVICSLSISTIFVHHNRADISTMTLQSQKLNGHILLNEDLTLSPSLKKLFNFLNAKDINTFEEANKYAQENFLRPKGIERQMQKPHPLESEFNKVLPILRSMKMIDAIPAFGHYNYLAFNGQSLPQMRRQVEFIKRSSVTFNEIVFATGSRNLQAIFDKDDPNFDILKSEYDAAKYLLKVYFPNKKSIVLNATTDKLPRPNTKTTVNAWMEQKPEPGSILMVSNNPYIGYQYLTWFGVLKDNDWFKKGGSLYMCGDFQREEKRNRLAVILDNVARTLFTEIEIWKK